MSETTKEASNAIVKLRLNGLNSSPTTPPTRATGKKTATVVIVADVIAPETSLTASIIARFLGSP